MGASAAINLSYVGQGPSGGGQIIADQTSGPKSKSLYAYGQLVSGSDATTATVNFIDGTQSLGQVIVTSLQSVAAPVTLNGVANQAFYAGNKGASAFQVGQSAVIAGFATSANNVTATVNVVTATGFYVTNASSVAETNPAATASVTVGGVPIFVNVFYSGISAGSTTADALFVLGTNHFQASLVDSKKFVLNYPTVTTSGVAINFGAVIAFSS